MPYNDYNKFLIAQWLSWCSSLQHERASLNGYVQNVLIFSLLLKFFTVSLFLISKGTSLQYLSDFTTKSRSPSCVFVRGINMMLDIF